MRAHADSESAGLGLVAPRIMITRRHQDHQGPPTSNPDNRRPSTFSVVPSVPVSLDSLVTILVTSLGHLANSYVGGSCVICRITPTRISADVDEIEGLRDHNEADAISGAVQVTDTNPGSE
jgi:hypothetical protein